MTCVHHYMLPAPNGPTVKGVCRDCGAVKVFPTAVASDVIFDAPHARMGAATARRKK